MSPPYGRLLEVDPCGGSRLENEKADVSSRTVVLYVILWLRVKVEMKCVFAVADPSRQSH